MSPPASNLTQLDPVASTTPDLPEVRKARGAYFTPPAIADFLAAWAVDHDPAARVLDPTCGEAVFLEAAGRRLRDLGAAAEDLVVGQFESSRAAIS